MRIGKAFSVFGLADQFQQEVGALVKDEVRLAKVEFSEKLTALKRNSIALGAGIFVAFAGLLVLSLALGRLLAMVFLGLGWSQELASFVGISAVGLVVALIGLIFLLKGVKTISQSSLKPERTIETLRNLGPGEKQETATAGEAATPETAPHHAAKATVPQPTKEELESRIGQTRRQLRRTVRRAGKRAAWTSAAGVVGRQLWRHPMRTLIVGAGAGLASRILRRRRGKHDLAL